ncbi:hypothetical protein DYH09_12530 [bacterium CPR1]|nr:hypothetical protein [bacterium CPR1]
MRVIPLNQCVPFSRPRAAVPTATSADSGDQVSLSSTGVNSRAWLWSSLATAGILSAGQTPGPTGVALSAEQRKGLLAQLQQVQDEGGKLLSERSWLGRQWNGSPFQDLTPGEALEKVTANPRQIDNLLCQPPGESSPTRVRSIATLAALDTLYFKADPTGPTENSLRNLYDHGYEVLEDKKKLSRLEAFEAAYSESYRSTELKGPTRLGGWSHRPGHYQKADFFHVTHDPRSLPDAELGQSLLDLQAQGWVENAEATYNALHGKNKVSLFYQKIPVASLNEASTEAVLGALERARPACELADRILVPLVTSGRLSGADAASVLVTAQRPDCDVKDLMRLVEASIPHARELPDGKPGQFAAAQLGKLLDQKKTDRVDTLIELVRSFKGEAPESLELLDSPKHSQGLWALPLSERSRHFQTLARLTGARDARTLLALLDKPMSANEVAGRVELLTRLAASEKLDGFVSTHSIERDYKLLAEHDLERTLSAYKKVADLALLNGGTEHVPALTLAELRGWDAAVLCQTAVCLSHYEGVKPEADLAALVSGAGPEEAAAPAAERYLKLVEGLVPGRQASQARAVFAQVRTEQDLKDFLLLLEHLTPDGHQERAAEVFTELRQAYPGDAFPAALRSALESLALGRSPDDLLRSAGTASALEVQEGQLRVGGVVLKTKTG